MHLETGPPTPTSSEETPVLIVAEQGVPLSGPHPPVTWPVVRFRLLAGLQAGVIGALVMLCYYSLASVLQRQYWWSFENLLGSAIYGNAAFWKGLSRVTLAGAGLQVILSGIAGMICSFLLPPFRGHGLVQFLVALATAALWYVLLFDILFPRFAPLIPTYTVRNLPVVAHLLLGISLSKIPTIYENLVRDYLHSRGEG